MKSNLAVNQPQSQGYQFPKSFSQAKCFALIGNSIHVGTARYFLEQMTCPSVNSPRPMGFRLNGQQKGNQKYPPISSIISLPLDIFPKVAFHSEILIFNLPNLQPHYFFNHPI